LGARIVINTYGSRGDIAPFLAIARGLQARGHHVVIASDDFSQTWVESAGLEFYHARRGIVYGHESPYSLLTYNVSNSYDDLSAAARRADLLITHQLAIAGPLVAATNGIPWVSVALSPIAFASGDRLLTFESPPGGYRFTPTVYKLYLRHINEMEQASRILTIQVQRFRGLRGLAAGKKALLEDHHSPHLVLAAFSPAFAAPQEHWPPQTRVSGFPVDEQLTGSAALPPGLERFLSEGPPPIVFTLGSPSVLDDGSFRFNSVAAAKLLGRRALLLGALPGHTYPDDRDVMSVEFAPHGEVLPRAAAMVHHGGIGTTAAAMRAGCPMLVLPGLGSCDMSENAARVAGLGVARLLTLDEYNVFTAVAELGQLLSDPSYAERAAEVSRVVRAEDGVGSACDAVEQFLHRVGGRRLSLTASRGSKPEAAAASSRSGLRSRRRSSRRLRGSSRPLSR
jgi:UDP:flavonoid glycosyltransferase YjiC (YdhE family)